MKVLMLGWELPPHNSGGLGVACLQLCKKLSSHGADLVFILPYKTDYDYGFMDVKSAEIAETSEIYGVYDSEKFSKSHGLSGDIYGLQHAYAEAMDSVLFGKEFDIIHAHDWLTFRAGLRAREILKKPLILHVHSIESDRAGGAKGNLLVREIEQLGMLLADKIVAVSELTKQKIVKEYFIPPEKIIVAHNGIDVSEMQDLDDDNAYKALHSYKENGYKIVSSISRLTVQKGLANLLQVAKMVVEKQPKTIFLIVGSGDQYRELLQMSAELGISRNVVFTGFLRGKKWRDAFGISDLFVMPSVSEPFGLTPIEAIVYDTPSLISKQSGVAEVLNSAIKVDFWDTNKMADRIINLLRYDSFRSHLLTGAKNELQNLQWDKAAGVLMSTYHEHKAISA